MSIRIEVTAASGRQQQLEAADGALLISITGSE